jgi:7-cyano-7-deazaguanine synthase
VRKSEPAPGPKSVVLLCSGGLDSTTLLAMGKAAGRRMHALSFDYGQRHACELECARRQGQQFGVLAHEVIDLRHMGTLVASASALISGSRLEVAKGQAPALDPDARTIPSTYVPARNTLFLSYALAWAEALGAQEIWIGANALDYSGYPDCRPAFLEAWEQMATLATRVGVEGRAIELVAPLVDLHKHEIVARGDALGVDYADTVSCYDPVASDSDASVVLACGRCESCQLRRAGFERAGLDDPTRYLP